MASLLNAEILEIIEVVPAIIPSDFHGQTNNGLWVAAQAWRTGILFFKGAGTSTQDPVLTLNQATDNLGTGSKALNFTRVRTKYGSTALSQTTMTQWSIVTQAAANTFTLTSQAVNVGMVFIDLREVDLDIANNFNHIQLSVASVGANAQLCSAFYIGGGLDYQQSISQNFLN